VPTAVPDSAVRFASAHAHPTHAAAAAASSRDTQPRPRTHPRHTPRTRADWRASCRCPTRRGGVGQLWAGDNTLVEIRQTHVRKHSGAFRNERRGKHAAEGHGEPAFSGREEREPAGSCPGSRRWRCTEGTRGERTQCSAGQAGADYARCPDPTVPRSHCRQSTAAEPCRAHEPPTASPGRESSRPHE